MIGHPLKVRELLDEIVRGEVLLPEIQRAYVWKGPQVAKLIDSLYREYPAGQILLWDTVHLPITKELEGVERPPLPTSGRPKIVLDGQQRLTSLYKALGPAEDGVEVYFNLETEQFQRYLRRLKADPRWVSVRNVVNGTVHDLDILQSIENAGVVTRSDPRFRAYLDRLQKLRRIGEYKFPIEIFRNDDYEEVTELFVRINSAGTRLRAAELVLAQLALRLPGALVKQFEEALDDYADVGFDLDSRILVRAFVAIGTEQSRFKYLTEFWKKSSKDLENIWKRTRKALDSAVNFVRQNAAMESSDWLPSLNALIPLAGYFDKHPGITPDAESELLRWFYLSALHARYSGSSETALDEDLRAVLSPQPIHELLGNVLPHGVALEVRADDFDDAGVRNPLFALMYAAIRRRGANDWFTGVALSKHVVGDDHEIEVHHIFPKALLKQHGVARRDRDELANLAFLTAKPNKIISKTTPERYLAKIAERHPHRLKAQCIPMERELWTLERYQDFLAVRRDLLAKAVTELIEEP